MRRWSLLKSEKQGAWKNKRLTYKRPGLFFEALQLQSLVISNSASKLSAGLVPLKLLGFVCRLKAIREAAGVVTPATDSAPIEQPKLKFRNYNVRDQKIEHTVLEPAKAPEYVAPKPEVPAGKTAEVLLSPSRTFKENARQAFQSAEV